MCFQFMEPEYAVSDDRGQYANRCAPARVWFAHGGPTLRFARGAGN